MPPTLLCVDADRSYCEILARAFEAEGYRVHTAHDGEAALAAARALRPDLVTLDVMLPKRDGFAVLEAMRTAEAGGPRTPVLFLAGGAATPAYRARAEALGASGIVTKPVPLDRLLSLVAGELESRSRATARRAAQQAPAPAARSVSGPLLEGSLAEVGFPALLHHLHGLRATGVLHLQCGKKKKKIQLAEGRPVAVKSNLVQETLGQLLAASGKISLDVMHESLLRVQRGEGLHGQILVAMHMLDEEDLAHALRHQAEEKLLEVFEWADGRFRFDRGARLSGGNVLSLKESPANLVLRGVMTRVTPDAIDAFFAAHAEEYVAPSEAPFYRFQDVDLDAAAEALLARVDGTRTLDDLLPLDERSRRLLYALHAVARIECRPAPAPAPTVRQPAPPDEASAAPGAQAPRAPRHEPASMHAPRAPQRADVPPAAPRRAEAAHAPASPRSAAAAAPPPAARPPAPGAAPRVAPPPRPARSDAGRLRPDPLVETPAHRAAAAAYVAPAAPRAPAPDEDALRAELSGMSERLRGRDYFAVLGVTRTATDEQIRDAYFALAKRTHPDRFSGASEALRRAAEDLFSLVSRAYETLGHRDRRNEYLRAEMTRERDRAEVEEGERALRAELCFQKGVGALKRKAYGEAREQFEQAVKHYPQEGEYHAYLGYALWLADPGAIGSVHEARQHLLRGRKLAPSSDKPYLFLGRLYKAEGKDAQAEKMFQRAVELDPDCVDAIRELRLIDMRRQRSKSLVQRILRR